MTASSFTRLFRYVSKAILILGATYCIGAFWGFWPPYCPYETAQGISLLYLVIALILLFFNHTRLLWTAMACSAAISLAVYLSKPDSYRPHSSPPDVPSSLR